MATRGQTSRPGRTSPAPTPATAALVPANCLLCAQPVRPPLRLPGGLSSAREFAIRIGASKWVNGTVLHYHFLDSGSEPAWTWVEPQRAVVRDAFERWKSIGIGLSFVEVDDISEAELVIGCLRDNRSWSYVGTDNLHNQDLGRTMNFGWDLATDWGRATALHEIGHAVGLSHEHQNPRAGIEWNEPRVRATFGGPPNNWDPDTIFHNILRKLDIAETEGSDWDPASIMEYPFEPGLILRPAPFDATGIRPNLGLSPADVAWARRWYPALDAPEPIGVMQLKRLEVTAGAQRDFMFRPEATRSYLINTVGEADSRVVVFEQRNGDPRHLAAQDDSGNDSNVRLRAKLVKGRTYVIRVRVNFSGARDGVGLLIA